VAVDILGKLFPADYARGRAEAEADIGAGVLKQRWSGKLAAGWQEAARLLQERYGVQIEACGACFGDARAGAYEAGYNERMSEEIRARFGSDVVADTCPECDRKRKKHRRA
jgi:hypothetical protein